MPEFPDVTIYVERVKALLEGQTLERVRLSSPFVLRSVTPPIREAEGRVLVDAFRLGKRLVLALSGEYFLVLHLMISGRLHWRAGGVVIPKKVGLLALDFRTGSLLLTEASSKKRASLHLVADRSALQEFERGGVEPMRASAEEFAAALKRENRTLKRALTDPRLLSGIGNAYSDEILFAARLSPVRLTRSLDANELSRLYSACQDTLRLWTERLRAEVGDGFPEHVSAFREGMAVHGRYRQPCSACGTLIQRIRYADNEVNYCPRCQTSGKLLADRGLSRLLKSDWPNHIEELEERSMARVTAEPAKPRRRPKAKGPRA